MLVTFYRDREMGESWLWRICNSDGQTANLTGEVEMAQSNGEISASFQMGSQ
jgi:hypothetical protein